MQKNMQTKILGRYIVADPKICHGKPTFRGTRIMVWQVMEMLADGMAWETIIEQCHNSIPKDAIAEAIVKHVPAFARYLPPVRKPWMSEDKKMGLFDAAALALTFIQGRSMP